MSGMSLPPVSAEACTAGWISLMHTVQVGRMGRKRSLCRSNTTLHLPAAPDRKLPSPDTDQCPARTCNACMCLLHPPPPLYYHHHRWRCRHHVISFIMTSVVIVFIIVIFIMSLSVCPCRHMIHGISLNHNDDCRRRRHYHNHIVIIIIIRMILDIVFILIF